MAIKTKMKSLVPRRQQYAKKFKLISGGFTNRQAWPDGEITVFPWDTDVDEWFVSAQEMGEPHLLAGLLEHVVAWNGATVDDIVVSEMMTILLMARSLTTGGKLHYLSECPVCHNKEEEALVVPDELEPLGQKGPEYPGYDLITLPDCQDVVAIRPLTMADDRAVEDREYDKKQAVPDGRLRKIMPVVAVNEGAPETLMEVDQWYQALSPKDARYLVEKEDELSPQLNRRIPHNCSRCKREFFHVIRFDADFFRSRSAGDSGTSMAKDVPAGVDGKGIPAQPQGGA